MAQIYYVSRPWFWSALHRFGEWLCKVSNKHNRYTPYTATGGR